MGDRLGREIAISLNACSGTENFPLSKGSPEIVVEVSKVASCRSGIWKDFPGGNACPGFQVKT